MFSKGLKATQPVVTRRLIILLAWISIFTWMPAAYLVMTLYSNVETMVNFFGAEITAMRKLTRSFWNTPDE